MKLPPDCPYVSMPSRESSVADCLLPQPIAVRGGPLCRVGGNESEVYRFVWRSSFHGDATVQIVRDGDAINLLWKYWSYSLPAADASAPLLTLSTVDWGQLQRRLDVASFWSLDPDSSRIGFDGASWLIEGRRKDAYHSISR